jgi:ABC-2 type transport system ATP-binding protein
MKHVITVENIEKSLGGRQVLKGINFVVNEGDIFGYLGPNGAGKTTTIRIFLGLLKADSGNLEIMGRDIEMSETRKKIGFVLDCDGLYDNMTAIENLMFYAQIYGLSGADERIERFLEMTGLGGRAQDNVNTYSRGMRQRLALARAMLHDPAVLILDEPTAGVDPTGQIEIRQLMLDISGKENKTIFLSSHNLDEVQRICNHIALIDRGEIKIYGELKKLRDDMGSKRVSIKISGEISIPLAAEIRENKKLGFEKMTGKNFIFSPHDETEVSDIINFLVSRDVKIQEVTKKETSLEELYSNILKAAEPL